MEPKQVTNIIMEPKQVTSTVENDGKVREAELRKQSQAIAHSRYACLPGDTGDPDNLGAEADHQHHHDSAPNH